MSNFGFLRKKQEYQLFAAAAIEAERVYHSAPAMCAVGARKALELAVKWVYSADNTIEMPYRDNLSSLIHEPTFRFALDTKTWQKIRYIMKLGNTAVHTGRSIQASDAIFSLQGLFEFIEWIDYCYGSDYEERSFDEKAIPKEKVVIDTKKIKAQESLIEEKTAEIEALRKKIKEMSRVLTAEKEQNKQERNFKPKDITEFETRKRFIDLDLKDMGWEFGTESADVWEEYPVENMAGQLGKTGRVDYVLFGKDGLPLAVIEAKKTSKDPNTGRKQAVLYADCLESKFGQRPMMFTTNGFETYFWDDLTSHQRRVSGIFSKSDLQKLMNRRKSRKDLLSISIDDKITDRYYQKEAIRAVCDNISNGFRKNLLVMATGTGKTRTASSLTDVLSRGGHITNILFLADRTALVKQAKEDFKHYLPEMSLCNLCSNKDDRSARIVFSTYPTMLNAIDGTKSEAGSRFFTPAHFDLIIIDESHRSIFKKYRVIFEYFDAILVGLTATPKTEVDRNTYDFFEMEHEVPTYAYDYETAVNADHVLVPYYNYEVRTQFLDEGITYDKLSEKDKARYEDDFTEDDTLPDFIPSHKLNRFIFNQDTVDTVLQDLMERGIKVAGGDRIGKTIIFAQNKRHGEYILERFNKLYPQLKGRFAQRVICDDPYAQTIIDDFKIPEKEPHIAVSVDMMDTGIDVPQCVNLVFFKKIRSKVKFWQMIGRGTRLAPNLHCTDQIYGVYTGKRCFLIFDYCGNFQFFREHKEGFESRAVKTLSEKIFIDRIELMIALQENRYASDAHQSWRGSLVEICHQQVTALNEELTAVKLKREQVEKFKNKQAFTYINNTGKKELTADLAPLVMMEDADEAAKRFDHFMYGLMLSSMENTTRFSQDQSQLRDMGEALEKRISIPQVKAKLEIIQRVNSNEFWEKKELLEFEKIRGSLRDSVKFLDDEDSKKKVIYTNLVDPAMQVREGDPLGPAYDFEDYKKKVNRYVLENGDTLAIHKLTHNIPLTALDYKELERVLTEELGSKEDYQREYGDTPFGLLVRKIAKMDHEAAMRAFSKFINDQSLNQKQIAFIHRIIAYIEQNGYMDQIAALTKPPFDKPASFIKLFDAKTRAAIVDTINEVKENAIHIVA
ncbi:MAG: DEAD/DEAH box helicase family protein [Firmicutes bacterium]|nr:DEAD/DEAH box helicase family protein [Bacillota bacterium]